ncbi:MAG: S41 family peptidase [Planctomycetota bacterium]|jgi:C-terminal processing protease CtpA/Prc
MNNQNHITCIIALILILTINLPAAQNSDARKVAGYQETFVDLYNQLAKYYPCFELKNIDFKAVGQELLPRAKQIKTDREFGLLCLELVARLEDSHAHLIKGSSDIPLLPFPQWDPGFACLIDDRNQPVVYYVDKNGPAHSACIKPGMTVLAINRKPADQAIKQCMKQISKYIGFSSQRALRYQAARWFTRQTERGAKVTLEMQEPNGSKRTFNLPATLARRYLPRLPVPIKGISEKVNVSWTMLENRVGYIYVRRIRNDLIEKLDRAVADLKEAKGLIIDVRGNSGGGFDGQRAHRNFNTDDGREPFRPRFQGPITLLIDPKCVSAGEGWASWFIANKKARLFGQTTAGASSRKKTYTLKNGLYKVVFPVKAYRGYLKRPIERRGLEPDVPIKQNTQDLALGRDTVLEAAKKYLNKMK